MNNEHPSSHHNELNTERPRPSLAARIIDVCYFAFIAVVVVGAMAGIVVALRG